MNKIDNQNTYNKSRFKIFFSNLIPSLLALFTKRNNNLIILNGFLNKSFSDNTKYLFLYLINNTDKEIKYVINDDKIRNELYNKYGDYFIETNSLLGKKKALSSYLWFTNAFEFPVGGLFLNFRRTVIHLTHGVPIKNSGLCEKRISILKKIYYKTIQTNISFSLATSECFRTFIAKHIGIANNKVIINGLPRFDTLYKNRYESINKSGKDILILYAPTWRQYAAVQLFPFVDFDFYILEKFLKDNNIIIYLRMHPDYEASIDEKFINSKQFKIFSGTDYPDINNYLANFDMLITDYSSIFYDFMIFDRPMFFFNYDYDEYEKNIGFAVNYEEYAVGYKPKTQCEFLSDVMDALANDTFKTKRKLIKELTIGKCNNNCQSLIQQLKELKIY